MSFKFEICGFDDDLLVLKLLRNYISVQSHTKFKNQFLMNMIKRIIIYEKNKQICN